MSCANCYYYSAGGSKWSKGYCNYYKSYVYPNDSCEHETSSGGSGGCYITTACVKSKNLPDDCIELTTLRKFRDEWLANQENGKQEIDEYYKTAPGIVEKIEGLQNSETIFNDIYYKTILPCVELINSKEYEKAYDLYKKTALKLNGVESDGYTKQDN